MNSFRLTGSAGLPKTLLLLVCLTGGMAVLAGCSSLQHRSPGERPVVPLNPPPPGQTDSSGAIRHDIDSPRIAQLWVAAEKAKTDNNLEQAEAYIQEALQIAPTDSVLWSRAAELKLELLDAVLAETYAGKSIAFAQDNGTLLHRNWLIIEYARELRGDLLGVRDAQKMVRRFQY